MQDLDKKKQIENFDIKLRPYAEKILDFYLDIVEQKRTSPKLALISYYLSTFGALTQKQMHQKSGLSTGAISTLLSIGTGLNLIKKELIPGTHTYKYSIAINIEDFGSAGIKLFLANLRNVKPFLKKYIEDLKPLMTQNKKGALILYERLEQLGEVMDFYQKIFSEAIDKL